MNLAILQKDITLHKQQVISTPDLREIPNSVYDNIDYISHKYEMFLEILEVLEHCQPVIIPEVIPGIGFEYKDKWITYSKVGNMYKLKLYTFTQTNKYYHLHIFTYLLHQPPIYIPTNICIKRKEYITIHFKDTLIQIGDNVQLLTASFLHISERNDTYYINYRYFCGVFYSDTERLQLIPTDKEIVYHLIDKLTEQSNIISALELLKTFITTI